MDDCRNVVNDDSVVMEWIPNVQEAEERACSVTDVSHKVINTGSNLHMSAEKFINNDELIAGGENEFSGNFSTEDLPRKKERCFTQTQQDSHHRSNDSHSRNVDIIYGRNSPSTSKAFVGTDGQNIFYNNQTNLAGESIDILYDRNSPSMTETFVKEEHLSSKNEVIPKRKAKDLLEKLKAKKLKLQLPRTPVTMVTDTLHQEQQPGPSQATASLAPDLQRLCIYHFCV